jgi:hypothetical protein
MGVDADPLVLTDRAIDGKGVLSQEGVADQAPAASRTSDDGNPWGAPLVEDRAEILHVPLQGRYEWQLLEDFQELLDGAIRRLSHVASMGLGARKANPDFVKNDEEVRDFAEHCPASIAFAGRALLL